MATKKFIEFINEAYCTKEKMEQVRTDLKREFPAKNLEMKLFGKRCQATAIQIHCAPQLSRNILYNK